MAFANQSGTIQNADRSLVVQVEYELGQMVEGVSSTHTMLNVLKKYSE